MIIWVMEISRMATSIVILETDLLFLIRTSEANCVGLGTIVWPELRSTVMLAVTVTLISSQLWLATVWPDTTAKPEPLPEPLKI